MRSSVINRKIGQDNTKKKSVSQLSQYTDRVANFNTNFAQNVTLKGGLTTKAESKKKIKLPAINKPDFETASMKEGNSYNLILVFINTL